MHLVGFDFVEDQFVFPPFRVDGREFLGECPGVVGDRGQHGLTPPITRHPRPDPAPPGHPDDRSGDTGYPAVGRHSFKINYRIPRSTGTYAVYLG